MQGKGKEGNFLGIFRELEHASVVIVPVAFDKTTTYGKGTDEGPKALIEASRNLEVYDIETDSEMYLKGIHTAQEIREDTSEKMLRKTHDSVLYYLNEGKFVITLGGEHSISQAPIQAHAERYGPISVLQFDAHSDLVPAFEGDPYSHASVMARVKEMENVKNIVSIGIRSMAKEEKEEMGKSTTFYAHLWSDDLIDQVIEKLEDRVYITFDLDVFDSSLMPATGTPEPGGLFWNSVMKILRKVIQKRSLIGFDVVELCPIPKMSAPDYLAAKLVYKILSYLFQPEEKSSEHFQLYEETL